VRDPAAFALSAALVGVPEAALRASSALVSLSGPLWDSRARSCEGPSVRRYGSNCDYAGRPPRRVVRHPARGRDWAHEVFHRRGVRCLADGRRIELHADRGSTEKLHGVGTNPTAADLRPFNTRENFVRGVLATVLPDDAEDTNEDHDWEWLSELLRARGIEASTQELRGLPYDVEFSDRLLARIPGGP
jgi:hypothetical protein